MPEASTGENQAQTGASAAKQMLAALTKHSQEMTKKFSESAEHLNRLNVALENRVNGRLSDINDIAEQIVRIQLENLSAEKDSVMAELTELRQEELKVLQSIGKELRDSLNSRLNELVSGLKTELDEKLGNFQEQLGQTEKEVTLAVSNMRKSLAESIPQHLDSVRQKTEESKVELGAAQTKQKELLNQETSLSLDAMTLRCDELKDRLEKNGAEYIESIDKTVERILAEQAEKLKQKMQSIAAMQEQASRQLDANLDDLEQQMASFGASCQQIADLRLRLHTSMATNMALIYRTELLSLAQETEDQLVIVRSHLHSVLRNYHEQYTEQANTLLVKFQNNAREAMPAASEDELSEQVKELPEAVAEFFVKLKQEMNERVKGLIATADSSMGESLSEFRARLNTSNQNICGKAENGFNDFRKEISETVEATRSKLDDLSEKADALEQLVDESKELISALDQSNLEF